MTTLALETVWFNLASDPTQAIDLELTSVTDTTEGRASYQYYSQGRRRLVSRPSNKKTLSLVFESIPREQERQLRQWINTTLVYRDPRGRRLWGSYTSINTHEIPGADTDIVDVSLTFNETSFAEEV